MLDRHHVSPLSEEGGPHFLDVQSELRKVRLRRSQTGIPKLVLY